MVLGTTGDGVISPQLAYYYRNKEKCLARRKAWGEKNKEHNYDLISESRKRNRQHDNARARVKHAVNLGLLIKPESCSSCGSIGPIDGHHEDYGKPLEVEWLCRNCHGKRHRKRIVE